MGEWEVNLDSDDMVKVEDAEPDTLTVDENVSPPVTQSQDLDTNMFLNSQSQSTSGGGVENLERLREEQETKSKENEDLFQTLLDSRATTSATVSHVLTSSIEEDVICPVTHEQNPAATQQFLHRLLFNLLEILHILNRSPIWEY